MGSLFRSEEMTLCQLFIQYEAAYSCVSQLGELGLVQFRDVNQSTSAFQRRFINEVRRCDEMERKLRVLEKEIKKEGITIFDVGDNPPAPQPKEMIDMEATFEKMENELKEVSLNAVSLRKTFFELTELKYILVKTQNFFEEQDAVPHVESMDNALVSHEVSTAPVQLGFVAGVILRDKLPSFERMLWRVCRGNVFIKLAEIEKPLEDPVTGNQVYKTVFIVFFQGEQLKTRVRKICEGFRATLYPCPETIEERSDTLKGVVTRMEDLNTILNQTQDHLHRLLVSAARNINAWFIKVRKIKAIYHTLNLFNQDVTRECLIAECWCAVRDLSKIQQALQQATEVSGSTVPSIINRMTSREAPPTYNRVNKFTRSFQNIVDAYGVSRYREVNPAPYTIITFPFLFAVMFGDAGHGLLMALFALWMVIKEKSLAATKSDNEIWKTIFGGRYIILLMGSFSIYTGLVYNDVFAKSLNIFGSSWTAPNINDSNWNSIDIQQLKPQDFFLNTSYPFGIDPVWQLSSNKIIFLNSYKMKLSVVFGVSQMFFGVILSILNHCYFKNWLNIICEFIPQVIFLLAIFGYLVLMVFVKWVSCTAANSSCAPSLLIMLINMFMFTYPTKPCFFEEIYTGQNTLQKVLVVLAVICIPWMLFIKPVVLFFNIRSYSQLEEARTQEDSTSEEHGFGDIFIHQAIHTIEYCLGSISHTASYLRLWALSLAHAQLSEVLWNMVMRIAINMSNWYGCVGMFAIFYAWAVLTVGILIIMEGLSAFLHALRLHWVEFQSKFYAGDGYIFIPFAFKAILEAAKSDG